MTNQPTQDDTLPEGSLQGHAPPLDTAAQLRQAVDQAFDYRGDVTIHTADGSVVEGYIFDRRGDGPDPIIRVMPARGSGQVTIRYSEITRLAFSGRDTAAGKSWETWVKKYNEKRACGESASMEPEPLD